MNLQLAVGPARPDGYHGVVTVYQALSLFDEVTVRPAERNKIVVTGEDADAVPTGPANLASQAATALARATGRRGRERSAVRIEIRKRIPMAAGLAGGSADAAATLVACNELWRTGLSQNDLCEVARRPGQRRAVRADRRDRRGPRPGRAADRGAGGRDLPLGAGLRRRRAVHPRGVRDLRPAAGGRAAGGGDGTVSAGAVDPELSGPLMTALRSGDPAAVGPALVNDLQPAAITLRPELRRALTEGREHGAVGAIVSGSGPTCAFLARDARHARDLAVSLTGAGICRGVAVASGPVPGAVVVAAGELA